MTNTALTANLGTLLHLIDPTLPIGGFNHSNGLETFVQQGVVKDAATLGEYVKVQLSQNWVYNDGAYMSLVYDAAINENLDQAVAQIIELDEQQGACKCAREMRDGSYKLGQRLLKIFIRAPEFAQSVLLQKLVQAMQEGRMSGYYPSLFGTIACIGKMDKAQAVHAFYYNMCVGVVTNGVKLIPLSQMAGRDLMFDLREHIVAVLPQTLAPDARYLGACTVAQDIRAMAHERLYSRLYMS